MLAVSTGNGVLLRLLSLIVDLLEDSRAQWFQTPDRPAKSLVGHEHVLDAIRQRDGTAAYSAMLAHLREVRNELPTTTTPSPHQVRSDGTARRG
jgi:GntR family transcriptional repressor for pyruvate dehydrogenase complex